MLTKEIVLGKLDIDIEYKTISVRVDTVIKEGGVELSRSYKRCGFTPGQLDELKAFLSVEDSPEIQYLSSVWTPEVISKYEDLVNSREQLNDS